MSSLGAEMRVIACAHKKPSAAVCGAYHTYPIVVGYRGSFLNTKLLSPKTLKIKISARPRKNPCVNRILLCSWASFSKTTLGTQNLLETLEQRTMFSTDRRPL